MVTSNNPPRATQSQDPGIPRGAGSIGFAESLRLVRADLADCRRSLDATLTHLRTAEALLSGPETP